MARSNKVARPAVVQKKAAPVAAAPVVAEEALQCPLCIEVLDDTDKDFFPCPCGYQVCLFCYGRLQKEYNNTCPGCRQQYGSDLEAVRQEVARKQKQLAAEAAAAARAAAASSGGAAASAANGHHAAAVGGRAAKGAAGAGAKQRQAHEAAAGAAARTYELHGGLPASANWGAAHHGHHQPPPQLGGGAAAAAAAAAPAAHLPRGGQAPQPLHQHQQQQPHAQAGSAEPIAAPADETAWPSLGAAAAANGAQHHHAPQRAGDALGRLRRQSSSSSLSSMNSAQHAGAAQQAPQPARPGKLDASRSSCDSSFSSFSSHMEQQGQQGGAQQHKALNGFASVEASAMVGGTRHSVCVPVPPDSGAPAFQEAATLLDMLQHAVSSSQLSSTEAAVQLVQLLRKLEGDQQQRQPQAPWLQQALAANGAARQPAGAEGAPAAARAPPPGFGGGAAPAAAVAAGPLASSQQHQRPPLATGPSAGTPYRPHLAMQADPLSSQHSSMHSVDSTGSLFSQGSSSVSPAGMLWTDSGLTGLDFGGAGGLGGLGGLGGIAAPQVPVRLQMLWADSGSSAAPPAAPAAPPGFGGGLGPSRLGIGSTSRLLNGSYNPLAAASAGGAGAPPGFGFGGSLGVAGGAESAFKQPQAAAVFPAWA